MYIYKQDITEQTGSFLQEKEFILKTQKQKEPSEKNLPTALKQHCGVPENLENNLRPQEIQQSIVCE